MCKWYCTSSGPSTNLSCLNCGCRYCSACLHGEAGKMQSLIKCARCGKKPGVKPNSQRGAWTAVCNPPMNEGGGPRYDSDDGFANSVFTSGLRSGGAQESNAAAQRRTASASGASGLRGPERFFYDRDSYTGTHTRGGPASVAKGGGTAADDSWKRPNSRGAMGPTLLTTTAALEKKPPRSPMRAPSSPLRIPSSPLRASSRDANEGLSMTMTMRSDILAAAMRPSGSTKGSAARTSSRGGMTGPERFFYDKSSYTGTHTRGGPSSVAKGGGSSYDQSWKRRD
eukprot:TRINITY_DN3302_c0_g1_i1.p1 TRINITY_DN3302_c0_g1~~TRINITY_DN3302_c0_g1_i1.p1  ORF type:complete len:283 (+),score=50.23 TRINITY_DN3302_c0_g1_i1:65-913(+)